MASLVPAATKGLSSDVGMRVEYPTFGAQAPSSCSYNLGHRRAHKVSTRKAAGAQSSCISNPRQNRPEYVIQQGPESLVRPIS